MFNKYSTTKVNNQMFTKYSTTEVTKIRCSPNTAQQRYQINQTFNKLELELLVFEIRCSPNTAQQSLKKLLKLNILCLKFKNIKLSQVLGFPYMEMLLIKTKNAQKRSTYSFLFVSPGRSLGSRQFLCQNPCFQGSKGSPRLEY